MVVPVTWSRFHENGTDGPLLLQPLDWLSWRRSTTTVSSLTSLHISSFPTFILRHLQAPHRIVCLSLLSQYGVNLTVRQGSQRSPRTNVFLIKFLHWTIQTVLHFQISDLSLGLMCTAACARW